LWLLSAGRNASATITTGAQVTTGLYNSFGGSLTTTADANGWFVSYCSGYRSSIDTTAGLATFTVRDRVNFEAGFRQYASAAAVTFLA
jgi:hypothetical protein